MKTPQLNLPDYNLSITKEGEKLYVFDDCRKKRVVLTPEEWVRQNFLRFLMEEQKFPKSLIRVESGLTYNSRLKRSDIVIYNNAGSPHVLVECKSYSTKITQSTFDQVAMYNKQVNANYIIVTNGLEHYCYIIDFKNNSYAFQKEMPLYK